MDEQSVLTVEQRKKLTMTAVESVDAFSETRILLTAGGQKIVIEGSGLKVLAFSKGSGNFAASGEVKLLRYGRGKAKFSGLFK